MYNKTCLGFFFNVYTHTEDTYMLTLALSVWRNKERFGKGEGEEGKVEGRLE